MANAPKRLSHFAGGPRIDFPKPGLILPRIDVLRAGHAEPLFLNTQPVLSSTPERWDGIALEKHSVPPVMIPRHEHPEHFLHLVLRGNVRYEVTTHGKHLQFHSRPGTIFILPRGTVDEINWTGETQRVAMAIHPRVLTKALEETAHRDDVELKEHWDLLDHHISTLLSEIVADLDEQSPAGTMYGESLVNALSVYLLKRYAVWPVTPASFKGGVPKWRLNRVLEYISENLDRDVSLSQLALIAGMSPHYFAELFRKSTGHTPYNYVLLQRIERAKHQLRERKYTIIEVGLNTGFQNPSHFARVFRQFAGTSPSRFRADIGVKHQAA
jgi:AraC family transcriptional regulator